jgi:hypothetical protein
VGLTNLPPSMSRLSRQYGILNISEPYRPPRPVTGIALLFSSSNSSRSSSSSGSGSSSSSIVVVVVVVVGEHNLYLTAFLAN